MLVTSPWFRQLMSSVEHPAAIGCNSVPGRNLPWYPFTCFWHVHDDDEKLIGVCVTNADALSAKERLRQKPSWHPFW